jgi:hypothetical protein
MNFYLFQLIHECYLLLIIVFLKHRFTRAVKSLTFVQEKSKIDVKYASSMLLRLFNLQPITPTSAIFHSTLAEQDRLFILTHLQSQYITALPTYKDNEIMFGDRQASIKAFRAPFVPNVHSQNFYSTNTYSRDVSQGNDPLHILVSITYSSQNNTFVVKTSVKNVSHLIFRRIYIKTGTSSHVHFFSSANKSQDVHTIQQLDPDQTSEHASTYIISGFDRHAFYVSATLVIGGQEGFIGDSSKKTKKQVIEMNCVPMLLPFSMILRKLNWFPLSLFLTAWGL